MNVWMDTKMKLNKNNSIESRQYTKCDQNALTSLSVSAAYSLNNITIIAYNCHLYHRKSVIAKIHLQAVRRDHRLVLLSEFCGYICDTPERLALHQWSELDIPRIWAKIVCGSRLRSRVCRSSHRNCLDLTVWRICRKWNTGGATACPSLWSCCPFVTHQLTG